jgi:tetratricopeptide repeat protein
VAIAPLPRERSQEAAAEDSPRLGAPAYAALLAFAALSVVYGALESRLWVDRLWGAHFYAFFPPYVLVVAMGVALAVIAGAAFWRRGGEAAPPPPAPLGRSLALAGLCALASGLLFWLLRERHLFWGDGLPLSIDVPRGQAFHPDEPLTMYLHHLLYRLGGGRWSGATAVAIGSVLAGMLFVGLAALWFARRGRDPWASWLAVSALLLQGFMALFYGHVENYSYLAVALLVFFLSGVDFLEGRGGPYVPMAAAVVAYALHILGGLTVVPAAVLVAVGLADRQRRGPTAIAVAGTALVLCGGALLAGGLYASNRSPLDGIISGAARVFGNTGDMRPRVLLSSLHWENLWSQFNLVGPLSVAWAALVAVSLGWRAIRTPTGLFFLAGIAALLGPCLLTGEGNLGAARNWDLFAAPALILPLAGLTLLLDRLDPARARRVMIALVAASAFHTLPWIVLNTDMQRTVDRIARLPFTGGRGEIMIGTHYLNEGKLQLAEHWFRLGLQRDFDNANGQSGLGLALARQGRLGEALGPMIAATRLRPGVVTYQDDLIALFLSLRRWEDAAAVLRDRLAAEPRDVDSWKMLAQLRARAGDPDGAVDVLEEACRQMPSDVSLQQALGQAYFWAVVQHGRRQEWSQAHSQLDRFAATFPGDPRVRQLREKIP